MKKKKKTLFVPLLRAMSTKYQQTSTQCASPEGSTARPVLAP